jgi:hypothetical protein
MAKRKQTDTTDTFADAPSVDDMYYLMFNHVQYLQEPSGNVIKYGTGRVYGFLDAQRAKELISDGSAVRTDANGNVHNEY